MLKDIAIIHYHFLPGGVTQVVLQSVLSLIKYEKRIERVSLVCGTEENLSNVTDFLRGEAEREDRRVVIEGVVIPEIGYLKHSYPNAETIKKELLKRFRKSLLWVHNYHIGKNPVLTQALLEIAHEQPEIPLIFHIHDFPECSRYQNLSSLKSEITLSPYPVLPNVRYAVINTRDLNILLESGIPEDRVFLLNNPVKPLSSHFKQLREKGPLQVPEILVKEAARFNKNGKNLLYPVRTIRRKNVFEAILITLAMDTEVNLIVTLPGVSRQEKAYSDLVEQTFLDGIVPGLWGTGQNHRAVDLDSMVMISNAVLSSSVLEGFGYLYLNSLQWGLPLLAREIDILDGIASVFSGYPHYFYSGFLVPLKAGRRQQIRKSYLENLDNIQDHLPKETRSFLYQEIINLTSEETVDFSYLSTEDQYNMVRKTSDFQFLKELRSLNQTELKNLTGLLEIGTGFEERTVEENFGLPAFHHSFFSIAESFNNSISPPETINDIQWKVASLFAKKEYIRLLYS